MVLPSRVAALCVLLLGLLASTSQAAPCAFESEEAHVSSAIVSPTGAKPFSLLLEKRPLSARPGPKGVAILEIKSPLRFTATQRTSQLGARLEKRTSIANGRIVLAKGFAPAFPELEGEAFTAIVEANDIPVHVPLEGLTLKGPQTLPCAALSISHRDDDFVAPSVSSPTQPGRYVNTREGIKLYAHRKLVEPLEVHLSTSFSVVAERDNWLRLRATWNDGSVVQGWVPMGTVSIRRGVPPDGPEVLGMVGGFGLCGGGHRPATRTLQLHSHAPIHDGPAGEIWAHTAGTIDVEVIATLRADGWIQIAQVEGLPRQNCSEHHRIWVHAKHVLWSPVVTKR